MAVVQRGGGVLAERRAGTMVKRGTKTTTRPVMKADFAGGGAGEASGLELIAGREEDADDQPGDRRVTADVAKLAVVHDGQRDEGQSHSEQIEEKRRGVLKSVFDEDEGCAPDEDDRQQQEVGQGGGAESTGQLVRPLRLCLAGRFAVEV